MKPSGESCSYTAKLLIIGDSGVGKTNLLLRYCESDFKTSYVPTIGVDFKVKSITVDGCKLKLQIWDTAGQERFKTVNQAYYKGSDGVVLVYSLIDQTSFENIESWIKQINEFTGPEVRKILVANKLDISSERKMSQEAGRKCAARYGIEYIEASARDGTNVAEIFASIGRQIKLVIDLEENNFNKTRLCVGEAAKESKCAC